MQETNNKMGTQPVASLILTMSLPAMFSMLIQSLYNIVDSIFVARYSADAFAAVSLAFPIQTLMIAVGVGTGVGINSLISRRLGEQNYDEANSAATHGIFLAVVSWAVCAVLGFFLSRPFFALFSAQNPALIDLGAAYTQIVTVFSAGVFVEIAIEKTLQATGNMIFPMLFQLTGAIANIILDPIFIFGLLPGMEPMGTAGAAIATVIGQLLALVFALAVLFGKKHAVRVSFRGFKPRARIIKNIYAVGFPSIVMQSITSVLNVGLNAILMGFSQAAMSVLGAYYKLQSFVFMPIFGITHGTMPVMGYNYGAGNRQRLGEALRVATGFAMAIMIVGTALFWIFPEQLLGFFESTPEMVAIGVPALRIISVSFVVAAADIMFSTLFQATGMGIYSLVVSVMRQLAIILPAAWIFSRLWGLGAFWFAFPVSELAALCASFAFYQRLKREKLQFMAPRQEQPKAAP